MPPQYPNQIKKKKSIGHRPLKRDSCIFITKIMSVLQNRVTLSFCGTHHNTCCVFCASESRTSQKEYGIIEVCTETIGGSVFINVVLVMLNILPLHFISHLLQNLTKQRTRGINSYKESWKDFGPNVLNVVLVMLFIFISHLIRFLRY